MRRETRRRSGGRGRGQGRRREKQKLEEIFGRRFSPVRRKPTIVGLTVPPCSKAASSIVTEDPYTRAGPMGPE